MKILSVAIPCYNSESYMEKCIKSLLPAGDDIEILVVNDGSTKDRTGEIADRYQEMYPDIVKAIHQENGGHGEAVNAGIRNASGLYFKVVDSDDWVNSKALLKIVKQLKNLEISGGVDLLLANFVYDKIGVIHKKVMRFKHVFPKNQVFEWDSMKHMSQAQYILMHNIIYRTQMLRECGLELPKHTFYVDNIFAYKPMLQVKKLFYMDVNLYHYFIGRDDQSVNEKVMSGRIDQQIKVNKIMIDILTGEDFTDRSKRLEKYMMNYLLKIMTVSSIFLILDGTDVAMEKKKGIWNYLREKDEAIYKKLRWSLLGIVTNLPGKVGRQISILIYKIVQKLIGFN